MENLVAGGMEISTLLNNSSTTSSSIGIEGNYSEKSSEKLYRNEVSPCVDPVVQAAAGEAKERLKKIEQEYKWAYKMYREVESNRYRLYIEGTSSDHYSRWAGYCIDDCRNLVKQLQNVLDRLNTEEATQQRAPKHSKKFFMLHGCTSLTQENKILQQKAEHKQPNNSKLKSQETIDFKEINWKFRYIQREIPRTSSKKHIHDLLSRLKETNKLREKATVEGAMMGDPTSQNSIEKSTSIVIKLLMKIIQELEKERRGTDKILREKRMIEKGFKEKTKKMRQLQEIRERLCEKWDTERKYLLGLNNTPDELLYFLPDFQRWMH